MQNAPLHPETLAVSAGYDPRACYGAAKPPVFLSTTFVYPSARHAKEAHAAFFDGAVPASGAEAGFIYARLDHPNLAMVQARMAALDRAEDCAVFASGMAAISATLLGFVKPGESIVHSRPVYGGTDLLLQSYLSQFGIRAVGCTDPVDEGALQRAIAEALAHGPLAMILLETPANPTATVADIALAARLADGVRLEQGRRPLVVVDNTFLGPLLQCPLEQGADLCLASLTKYAAGHSDVLAGSVSGRRELVGALRRLRTVLGSMLDPHGAWMLLRSLETLALRTERAGENARRIADFLRAHPKVRRVTWLGFLPPGTPARAVYDRQCSGAGSTFSFSIAGGEPEAFRMLDRLAVLRMAVSLGGTETLICHSATTTHYATPRAQREEVGIDDGTLRISVGVENVEDLLADLAQALEAI